MRDPDADERNKLLLTVCMEEYKQRSDEIAKKSGTLTDLYKFELIFFGACLTFVYSIFHSSSAAGNKELVDPVLTNLVLLVPIPFYFLGLVYCYHRSFIALNAKYIDTVIRKRMASLVGTTDILSWEEEMTKWRGKTILFFREDILPHIFCPIALLALIFYSCPSCRQHLFVTVLEIAVNFLFLALYFRQVQLTNDMFQGVVWNSPETTR